MPTTDAIKPDKAPLLKPVMLPHLVLRDFLDEETVAGLLDHTLAHETAFTATATGRSKEGAIKPEVRRSVGIRNLGPFKPILKSKILGLLPDLVAKLGATPVTAPKLELQLVAHNEGAFYKRHIDTQTASERNHIRVLSGVYYFHAQPKAFTGGALRLYAIGGAGGAFIDVEPQHNSLLVFPSWAPHEVMPVGCPSRRFIDSRFAINCWVHRIKADATV